MLQYASEVHYTGGWIPWIGLVTMMIRGLRFTVKGGKGSGWYGPPKGDHIPLKGVPGHVWERAGQRTGFKVIRNAIKQLKKNPLLPAKKSQKWHLKLDGKGFLVGNDAKAVTVLRAGMSPKADSIEVKL